MSRETWPRLIVFLRRWKEAEARRTTCPHHRSARGHRHADVAPDSLNRSGNAKEPLRRTGEFSAGRSARFLTLASFDMVIGTRGETFVLAPRFQGGIKGMGNQGQSPTGNKWQRLCRQGRDSCSGRRCHRRTSRCRKSERTTGGEVARASERRSFNERIELGLPRPQPQD